MIDIEEQAISSPASPAASPLTTKLSITCGAEVRAMAWTWLWALPMGLKVSWLNSTRARAKARMNRVRMTGTPPMSVSAIESNVGSVTDISVRPSVYKVSWSAMAPVITVTIAELIRVQPTK